MIERPLKRLANYSVRHPWWVIGLTLLATAAFASQFLKITIDTDPKHMLPVTSPVRQYNDLVEREFALHADVIALASSMMAESSIPKPSPGLRKSRRKSGKCRASSRVT
jgi:predicted RND superfamily exporter protein